MLKDIYNSLCHCQFAGAFKKKHVSVTMALAYYHSLREWLIRFNYAIG